MFWEAGILLLLCTPFEGLTLKLQNVSFPLRTVTVLYVINFLLIINQVFHIVSQRDSTHISLGPGSFPRNYVTHSATATRRSHTPKRGFERHEQESGRCVCFSQIRALQGAMLVVNNFYQDNDNLGNM